VILSRLILVDQMAAIIDYHTTLFMGIDQAVVYL